MKFVVFSDLHIHTFKQFSKDQGVDRLEHLLRCLKLVFAYTRKQGITRILFTGDMFEQHKSLPTLVVNRTIEVFKELFEDYTEIGFYSISGNHDHDAMNLIAKEANSSQKFLDVLFENFTLLDNQSLDIGGVNLLGVPYYEYGEDFTTAIGKIQQYKRDDIPNILMIHQTPKGVHNGDRMKVDMDESLYAGYDLVLCGHIHLSQRLAPNFLVVGAPTHQNFSDTETLKGLYVIDTEDLQGEYRFVNLNSKFPVFIQKDNEDQDKGEKEGDYIAILPKIVGANDEEQESIDNFRTDIGEESLIKNYFAEISEDDPSLEKYKVEKNDKLLTTGINLING